MWIFESSFGKNGDIGFHPDLTSPLLSTWTLCSVPKPSKVLFITFFSQPLTAFSSCPSPSWSTFRADPYVSLTFQGLSISLCLITSHQFSYLSQLSFELSSHRAQRLVLFTYSPPPPNQRWGPHLVKMQEAFVLKGEKLLMQLTLRNVKQRLPFKVDFKSIPWRRKWQPALVF